MEEINYPCSIQNYKVLVKTITYNQAKYIQDTLNGVAMQKTTFPFVEVIVDDCSTDGEQKVIKTWLNENCDVANADFIDIPTSEVIIVKHKTNLNCTFAIYFLKRNLWKEAEEKRKHFTPWEEKCDYTAFCEGDDYWIDPYKLQKQVDALDANPKSSMCYTAVNTVDEHGNEIIREGIESFIREAPQGDVYRRLLEGNFILTVSTMYRKEVFSSWIYKSCYIGLDYFLFLNAASLGDVIFIPERTCTYRKTPTGAMATKFGWVGELSSRTKELFILLSSLGVVKKTSIPNLDTIEGIVRYMRRALYLDYERNLMKVLLKEKKMTYLKLIIAYIVLKKQNLFAKLRSL